MVSTNTDKIVEQRVKNITSFFKNHKELIIYAALFIVILLAVYIRMLPTATNVSTGKPGLWDFAADTWTLGPDLDPFLFLRWAEYIVDHGSLMSVDTMRYVPLGFQTDGELVLLPYSIAWFHNIISLFGISSSVTYSAIIFPAFFFALTLIAFFFMAREMFVDLIGKKQSSLLALISSVFLAIIPALLPRTIAGIPEKESMGFFFIFLTFFLFIKAWKQERRLFAWLFAAGAALSTVLMSLTWGGVAYIFITLALANFLAFIFGKIDRSKLEIYVIWILTCFVIMPFISSRYSLTNLFNSTMGLIPLAVLGIMVCHEILFGTHLKSLVESYAKRLPPQITSILVTIVLGLIGALIFFGPGFVSDKLGDLVSPMITPISDRLGVTVAENRQPFFNEWASSFGPIYFGIPTFFWIFIIGSVCLVYSLLQHFTPLQKKIITASYSFFLVALIFSRYTAESVFNGTSLASLSFYALGVLVLAGTVGRYYFESYRNGSLDKFKLIHFGPILLFSFFFLSLISARGSVRTIMVLVPTAAMMASFIPLLLMRKIRSNEDSSKRNIFIGLLIAVGFLLLLAAINFYSTSTTVAQQYVPSIYTYQWQNAMGWVRENTQQNAVFAHWWDYGYWVQSIGKRATVLDGGNAIAYWNHLMGRLALTGEGSSQALPFLFAHNATHLLIDPTEIGKYSAFASIGSDENYDRASYIPTFVISPQVVQEKKNSSIFVYQGTFGLDEDIIYNDNGTRLFLPAGQAAVVGVFVEKSNQGEWGQPQSVIVHQGRQYSIPLKYAFVNNSLITFDSGIEAGVFVYPSFDGQSLHNEGVLLYLSPRTIKSNVVQLYLFGQPDSGFSLVHSENDLVVSQIKSQLPSFSGDFLDYQGFRGPIKIWEINYPSTMQLNQSYLEKDFPNKALNEAR